MNAKKNTVKAFVCAQGIEGSYYDIPKATFYLLRGTTYMGILWGLGILDPYWRINWILLPPGSNRQQGQFLRACYKFTKTAIQLLLGGDSIQSLGPGL